jgi:serine/threonine protein kinase
VSVRYVITFWLCRSTFAIDMELMQPTDLFEALCDHGRGFKESQVKHIAIQLVQAVAMLEANSISHRDIKLSNITFPQKISESLVASPNVKSKHRPMQIKLADFGMAGFLEKDGYLRGRCGTPGYVAPGMLNPFATQHY